MTASDVKTAILHRRLTETMGEETATALMERLPPDWAEVATKSDLNELRTELCGEMAELRTELRGEMTELRTELRGEMADMKDRISRDLRTVMFMIVGVALAFVATMVSIAASGALTPS